MKRAIRHKSIEQARRLQKVDEKRQLPKRRKSRLPVGFVRVTSGRVRMPQHAQT
jgi:hypothetical protein